MTDLPTRLEQATAGSRELDAEVWAYFNPQRVKVLGYAEPFGDRSGRTQVFFSLPPKRTELVTGRDAPHADPATTSIDAAVALAGRVLPGCRVMVERGHDGAGWAMVKPAPLRPSVMSDAATPALALCAAIIRAQAEQVQG